MRIHVSLLVNRKQDIIPGIARKFHISESQAVKFLMLAVEELARSKKLTVMDGEIIGGDEEVGSLIREVEGWTEDEFDEEDFEIIGYCRSIADG
nr:hypothetical protein [Candidatus Bathyarchaeota archaeon]